MKTLFAVLLIGGAGLWYVSHRTGTDFSRTGAAREAGGHSILKADAEPQPIKIVGGFVDADESGAVLVRGHTEDCQTGTPGCFEGEVLMMVHQADAEQLRMRVPVYRGSHYFLGAGVIRNDDNGQARPVQHFGSLEQAKRKR